MPSISVIIPIYNVEKYIEKCIYSIFNQTMQESIEFIFVDDNSPDRSLSILNRILTEYPNRKKQTHVISHKRNKGLAAARNSGMQVASGDYILHCDSDDWLEPDMILSMYNRAIETNADIVTCDFYGNYKKREIYYPQLIPTIPSEYFSMMLEGRAHYAPWNKLIKSELYAKVSPLWTEGINMWEDVSVIPRLVYYADKIEHVARPLYHYNQINNNSYSKDWNEKSISNIITATEIIRTFVKSVDTDNRYLYRVPLLMGHAKFSILLHCPIEHINKYRYIYPEFKLSDIRHISLPIFKKVILLLFLCSQIKLGRYLFKGIEKFKRIIR